MKSKIISTMALISVLLLTSMLVSAQNELAATLEVLNPGVEVQRFNTSNPIAVQVEAIVGVGDIIRTNETGQARITFFADGTDATLEPNTEYRIVKFEGNDEDFQLTVEALAGQTTHRLNRALGASSSYDVQTPSMTLAARGTVFTIRVEENGRAAMLVREGTVDAKAADNNADVPPDFGIRASVAGPLSDVVRATNFAELDAALDGCDVTVTTPDDVRLNVRIGPAVAQPRVGTIAADEISTFLGISESGSWYRIAFRGGFGWILSSSRDINADCAGLRVFADTQVENVELYELIGDPIEIEAPSLPEATSEPDNN